MNMTGIGESATMRMTARIAARHGGLWSFDRWYRLAWYAWPVSAALLICGWIVIE